MNDHSKESIKLPLRSRNYFRLIDLFGFLIILLIIITLIILKNIYSWSSWWNSYIIFFLLILGGFLWTLLEIVLLEKYRQQNWTISITSRYIELSYNGYFLKNHKMIPLDKIQFIDVTENPILKKFDLQSLKVTTLAHNHEINALSKLDAKYIKEKINSSLSSPSNNTKSE